MFLIFNFNLSSLDLNTPLLKLILDESKNFIKNYKVKNSYEVIKKYEVISFYELIEGYEVINFCEVAEA